MWPNDHACSAASGDHASGHITRPPHNGAGHAADAGTSTPWLIARFNRPLPFPAEMLRAGEAGPPGHRTPALARSAASRPARPSSRRADPTVPGPGPPRRGLSVLVGPSSTSRPRLTRISPATAHGDGGLVQVDVPPPQCSSSPAPHPVRPASTRRVQLDLSAPGQERGQLSRRPRVHLGCLACLRSADRLQRTG